MHRGCVNNFPISAKIARERSAWSPIDSNSDGPLRLWWTTDFGSVSANAAESAVAAEQPIDTIKKNERTNIVASPRKVSATRANCSALPERHKGLIACACRKSNPNILVVQPVQDRAAKNGPRWF